jgi:pimeloyl-ACP methyl ester carboxylesterase
VSCCRLLLAVAAAAALWIPGPAGAAIALAPCGKTAGLVCGAVAVPLDRSGQTPGTISLHVEELPALGSPRGAMFLIAGGPGQGSAHAFDLGKGDNATFFRFLFPDYTLVAFDDRGTGSSGLLQCPAFQTATTVTADQQSTLVAQCADAIGPDRRFYSTADHAADVEAVRQALGLGTIGLYGVSYGTKLALAYALAYPGEVDRLLLDSVLPASFPDPYTADVLRELPATLAAFCADGSCKAATPNFARDVVTLANRLEAEPLEDLVLGADGRWRTVRVSGEDLLSTVIQADLSPGLAAELPAAVHAALAGYTRPLARLFELTAVTEVEPSASLSAALYAATTCDDGLFPWSPETPVPDRPARLQQAIAALPAGTFGPFGSWGARLGSAEMCLGWPSPAGGAPLGQGPLPDVPMLALSGGFDMRTPTASAAAVAAMFPEGRVLVVPGVGHSVLTTDQSFCSQRAVRNWAVGGSVPASCPRGRPFLPPLGPFPGTPAGKLSPAATARLVAATVREATAAWLQVGFAPKPSPVPGLYAGRLGAASKAFTLTRYALVPGVELTGRLSITAFGPPLVVSGTLRVAGREAAPGSVRVTAGKLTGMLGGAAVHG